MARSTSLRSRLAVAAGVCTLSVSFLPLLSGAASAATPAASTAVAQQGASYLVSQINSSGFIPLSGGGADLGSTVQAVLALHAAGVGGTSATAAETYLAANAAAYLGGGTAATDDPGRLARLIMVAVASGADPTAYGSTSINLVARLLATQNQYTVDGPVDAGLFGGADPTFDGALRQGLALAALSAAGVTNTAGTGWLVSQQCADGGWESYRTSTATACTPADPVNFDGEDTNSTALAVEGLVAQGVTAPVSPKTFLLAIQGSDGGFGFFGDAADPDSTGLVIQALVALGEDPSSSTWTKGSATPFTALASFQLGCSTATPGAFVFPGISGANMFATLDAIPGAAGTPFPLTASTLAPSATSSCVVAPAPTTSAPTTPAPTATVAATGATLPNTGGSDTFLLLIVAGVCVVSGAGSIAVSRRRTGTHQQ